MDSCGASNPVKAVQSHLRNDPSAFRVAPTRHPSNSQPFRSAKQLSGDDIKLATSFASPSAQFEDPYRPQLINNVRNDWSGEFIAQHKLPPRVAPIPAPQRHVHQPAPLDRHSEPRISTVQLNAPIRSGLSADLQSRSAYHPGYTANYARIPTELVSPATNAEAAAFDRAFDNIEAMLANSNLKETAAPAQETHGLKDIAKKIIDTTSSAGVSGETAEKFKNSKFMSFMGKVSQGSVDIVDGALVEKNGGTIADASDQLDNLRDIETPKFVDDSDSTRLDHHSAPEDPFAFIEMLARRGSDKIEASKRELFRVEASNLSPEFMSPLEQAQQLAGLDIPASSWEQDI